MVRYNRMPVFINLVVCDAASFGLEMMIES